MVQCSTAGTSARRSPLQRGGIPCVLPDMGRLSTVRGGDSSAAADAKGEAMGVTVQDVGGTMLADPQPTTLEQRRRKRLGAMLARAVREGARLQFWARSGALAVVAVFFGFIAKWDASYLFILGSLLFFFLVGAWQYWLVRMRRDPPWLAYVVGTLDIVLVTWLLVGPNPFADGGMPPAMQLRDGSFKYLLIFVCLGALTLSPRLALWLGIAAAISWSAAVRWVISQPGTVVSYGRPGAMSAADHAKLALDPNFVSLIDQTTHVVVILIITGILAIVVSRSRRLADDYIVAERARVNLARHFSPNLVDELASTDEPFGPVRRQEVAVLFADIVGFTAYSEDQAPEAVFELLRQFHRRMEQVVFDHGGTVDNYIGDCIMATFGVPHPAADDPLRALNCARAMIGALRSWNGRRVAGGEPAVDVRIGAQYGTVVLGAVGSERNLSVAVVGDTCNVASRLQALCRELDAEICIGDELIAAIGPDAPAPALAGLVERRGVTLRGRDEPVNVWALPQTAAA